MTTSSFDVEPRAIRVAVGDQDLNVDLADGRRLSVPLAWFPRLLRAESPQRRNVQLHDEGRGLHWPDLDEDLSVASLLRGTRAPGSSKRAI